MDDGCGGSAPEERRTLWTTAFLLMGLRHPPGIAAELQEEGEMEESSTYQWINRKRDGKRDGKREARGRQEGMVREVCGVSKESVDLGTPASGLLRRRPRKTQRNRRSGKVGIG